MDARKIEAFVDRYGSLSPDAIAALDEDRHTLSGEEAAALDRVIQDPARRQKIADAIDQLDVVKRRSFRLLFLEFPAYAFATLYIDKLAGIYRSFAYVFLLLAAVIYARFLRTRLLRIMAGDPVRRSSQLD